MNNANIHVLSNVIAAVESGGQIYSDNRDWTAYAGAYANSEKEVTCLWRKIGFLSSGIFRNGSS